MKLSPILSVLNFSILIAASAPARAQTDLYTSVGGAPGDHLGYSVCGARDLDGDGVPDLLYGAPYSSAGAPVGGEARAVSGRTGALLHTWTGTTAGDNFGWAVAPAGDFDHDGINDVAVSAFGASPSGEVRLYTGSSGALIDTKSGAPGEAIGRALAGGVDLNGDGWTDLVVGIASTNGSVRVYTRSPAHLGVLYDLVGAAAGDMFGRSVAVGGDINNDGFPDIIIGAPGNDVNGSGAGMVRVYSGRNATALAGLLWTWYGDDLADSLGESVASAGDVDGDGYGDVIAGAPYYEASGHYPGLARIYSGRTGAVIRTLIGDPAFNYFGSAVAGVGDLDGDGKAEVAVGTPHSYSSPMTDGMVQIFSGATGALVSSIYGDTYDAYEFGSAIANPGDLNGDGKSDLVIGSSEDSGYTGGARSYLLGFAAPSEYCTPKTNSLGCVPAIAHSGAPSLSIGDNFVLSASNVRNRKPGILLWSHASAATPFGGGTLCVAPPVTRTPGQDSGGAPLPANDCSGVYSWACNHAYMSSHGWVAGWTLFAQYWSRDPGFPAPNNIGLSNAVSFTTCP